MKLAVIGAGIAGLTFGALAAKGGHEVTVIDRNQKPGGVMALAEQDGFSFEQGPLILTDLLPDEPVGKILASLDIHPELMRDDRGLITQDFALIRPDTYAGPSWRREKLKELFPQDAAGIDEYYRFYDALMEIRYLSGQKQTPAVKCKLFLAFQKIRKYEKMSCKEFTEKLFSDERLRLVFNGILADFCADADEAACFTLPFVNTETAFDKRIPAEKDGIPGYYPTYHYLVGGCQTVPEALCAYITSHGGRFLPETVADKVMIEHGKACGVRLADGTILKADAVVGSGSAKDFFQNMVGYEHLDLHYRSILDTFMPMEAVFMVHLGVKDYDPSVYQKQSLCYYYGSYDLHGAVRKLRTGIYHEGEDGYLIYFPDRHAPAFAPEGCHCVTIYTVCPDTLAEGSWEEKKEAYADRLIRLAERQLPGLSEHIVTRLIRTAEDYRLLTHMSKSSFGGTVPVRDKKNPPHVTPVKDLFFVGQQSENGGGVPVNIIGAADAFRKSGL